MRLEHFSPANAAEAALDVFVPLRSSHDRGGRLRRHQHDSGYAAIVLSGSYIEAGDTGRHELEPGDVVFHGPFESHLDRFESTRVDVLNLPLPPDWVGPILGTVEDPGSIMQTAECDVAAAVSMIKMARTKQRPRFGDWPTLLANALLENPNLCLAEWSATMHLHPGSVARGFRQQFELTPVRFREIARTRMAMQHLPGLSLSQVAAEVGFADQPHMARAMRRLTGMPPKRLREYLAGRSGAVDLTSEARPLRR